MKKKERCPPAAVLDASVNEALRKSEERYRALFEYAPDGVLIADAESFYIDGNTSICRMLGYSRDELIGLNASDIVAQAEVRHIGSALSDINAKSEHHREWLFQRKDRSFFSAEVKATMMPDGNLMAVVRDISERKAAESALRDSEMRFGTAFRSSPVGIAINRRSDLVILEVNAAFLRLFECSSEEIVGHNLLKLGLFEAQIVASLGKQLSATGAVDDVDLKARSRLGKELRLNISIRTIVLGGEDCSLSTMVDITGRERAAREIRDQLDELLRWQEVMLNREGRVQALKGEVNELLLQGKSPPRYADPSPR